MVAAQIDHITSDDDMESVAWLLPSSKAAPTAQGISRTCCSLRAVEVLPCSYQLAKMLKEVALDLVEELEMSLAATCRMPLLHSVTGGVVQKFQMVATCEAVASVCG